jgi:hypothetical protein
MLAIDCLAHHLGYAEVAAGREVFHQGDDGDRVRSLRSWLMNLSLSPRAGVLDAAVAARVGG